LFCSSSVRALAIGLREDGNARVGYIETTHVRQHQESTSNCLGQFLPTLVRWAEA
jgi:hypothetical protein